MLVGVVELWWSVTGWRDSLYSCVWRDSLCAWTEAKVAGSSRMAATADVIAAKPVGSSQIATTVEAIAGRAAEQAMSWVPAPQDWKRPYCSGHCKESDSEIQGCIIVNGEHTRVK